MTAFEGSLQAALELRAKGQVLPHGDEAAYGAVTSESGG